MNADDLLLVLPLATAGLWGTVAYIPLVRYRFASPFRASLSVAFLSLAAWSVLDWAFFRAAAAGDVGLALVLSQSRNTAMTLAMFSLLVSAKWIYRGHSRYDILLGLPLLTSLALIWGGMTTGVALPAPTVERDPTLYALWVALELAYVGGAMLLFSALFAARRDLPSRLRTRFFGGGLSLFTLSALWLGSNLATGLSRSSAPAWLSPLLAVPAIVILLAFAPLSSEEIGEVFLGVAAVEQRVSALYVFYRTGEPLVALGASRSLPIEAEQLQGVLDIVGNFVETSMKGFRGYEVTALRFDRLGIVAVRGQYIIVAALYDGPVYDVLRAEMLRSLREFEERRWQDLATWEAASHVAEEVADDLSRLVAPPAAAPSSATKPTTAARMPTAGTPGSRAH